MKAKKKISLVVVAIRRKGLPDMFTVDPTIAIKTNILFMFKIIY